MFPCTAVIALLLAICSCNAWRRPLLLHGRLQHGMLPPPRASQLIEIPEQWFSQRLDHFDPQNTMTWQQRYFVNDSFWTDRAKGPVFVMLGGEGTADPFWLFDSDMMINAGKYGAIAFLIEHRYFFIINYY